MQRNHIDFGKSQGMARFHIKSIFLCCLYFHKNIVEFELEVYLEDALSERSWIDKPECCHLVKMIEGAFETLKPSEESLVLIQAQDSIKLSLAIESIEERLFGNLINIFPQQLTLAKLRHLPVGISRLLKIEMPMTHLETCPMTILRSI